MVDLIINTLFVTVRLSISWMPPREVAEAERLHDLAEEVDRLLVGEGVVEGHDKDSHNAISSA